MPWENERPVPVPGGAITVDVTAAADVTRT
jgi:hypothetical protein